MMIGLIGFNFPSPLAESYIGFWVNFRNASRKVHEAESAAKPGQAADNKDLGQFMDGKVAAKKTFERSERSFARMMTLKASRFT